MDYFYYYSRLTLPKNFLVLFLKTEYQYLFTFASIVVLYKAGQKNLFMLSSHFWALKYNFHMKVRNFEANEISNFHVF